MDGGMLSGGAFQVKQHGYQKSKENYLMLFRVYSVFDGRHAEGISCKSGELS